MTTKHQALLLVDTISSLGSLDFRMDEWKIDAVVGGSQKGLMLPTGMSFTGSPQGAWTSHANAEARPLLLRLDDDARHAIRRASSAPSR